MPETPAHQPDQSSDRSSDQASDHSPDRPDAPRPREVNDLAALKTLAHPRRGRIMRHLAAHGPATSAGLGRALGLNTGATSYHLRELARHGFVEEVAPDDAHGRERWWRAVRADLRFPPRSRQTPEMRDAVDEMNRLAFASDIEAFVRFQQTTEPGDPWADAAPYSRGTVHVTADELAALFEEFIALINRYKKPGDSPPPGARTVQTRFLAFPAVAPPDESPPDESPPGESRSAPPSDEPPAGADAPGADS